MPDRNIISIVCICTKDKSSFTLYTPQRIQQVKQRMQNEPKLQEAWGDIKKTADEALQKGKISIGWIICRCLSDDDG